MSASIASMVATGALKSDFLGRLDLLQEVERDLVDAAVLPPANYIRQGNYLAQAGASLRALPRSLVGRSLVPAWKFHRLARLAKEWMCGNVAQVASGACLIEARPHWKRSGMFRSFYEASQSTVKLTIDSSDGRNRLESEIRARQIVEQLGAIRTPKILGQRDTASCVAIHEEWIDGRTFRRHRDVKTLSRVLLPQLGRHYQAYGIREISLDEAVGPAFTQQVAEAAALFPWPSRWMDQGKFLAAVQKLEDKPLNLPVSFCHGDLAICHVLFDNQGAPIVIDWDGGREAPIAIDLEKLNRFLRPYSKPLLRSCLELLGTLSTPTTYSPHAQLSIMALRSATAHRQREASRIKHGRPAVGLSPIIRKFRFAQWLLRQDTTTGA